MGIVFNAIKAHWSLETGFQFDFQLEILQIRGSTAVGSFVTFGSPGTRIQVTHSQI